MYSCPRWVAVLQFHGKACLQELALDRLSPQACHDMPNEFQSGCCNQPETRSWVDGLVVRLQLILAGHRDSPPVRYPELDLYRKNKRSADLLQPRLDFRLLPSLK